MDTATITLLAQANVKARSRRAFAKEIGVEGRAVAMWERGTTAPTEENLVKLCEFAKLDPAETLLDIRLKSAASPAVKKAWAEVLRLYTLGKKMEG